MVSRSSTAAGDPNAPVISCSIAFPHVRHVPRIDTTPSRRLPSGRAGTMGVFRRSPSLWSHAARCGGIYAQIRAGGTTMSTSPVATS